MAEAQRSVRPLTRRRAGRDRTEVLAAAARVIAERGVDATRFVDVSAAAGVPVSSLQYYFGSREDMLVAAFRHSSQTTLADLRGELASIEAPWARIEAVVETALRGFGPQANEPGRLWVESWRFALRDAELREEVLQDNASWRALVAESVRDGQLLGDFTAEADPDRVAVQVVALFDGIGLPVALGAPAVPPQQAAGLVLAACATLLGYSRSTQAPPASRRTR